MFDGWPRAEQAWTKTRCQHVNSSSRRGFVGRFGLWGDCGRGARSAATADAARERTHRSAAAADAAGHRTRRSAAAAARLDEPLPPLTTPRIDSRTPESPRTTEPRPPQLQFRVIQQGTHRLVGDAIVGLYTMEGKLIAQGHTNRYGEPVYPETHKPVDPKLHRLRVKAWYPLGAGSNVGETMIQYDPQLKAWRPETIYRFEPVSQDSMEGEWEQRSVIDPATSVLLPRDQRDEWPPRVRIMIKVHPVPVRSYVFVSPCW